MPRPNASLHNPGPSYLKLLLARARLSQRGAAKLLGINERTMRYYCSGHPDHEIPYVVQYALEMAALDS